MEKHQKVATKLLKRFEQKENGDKKNWVFKAEYIEKSDEMYRELSRIIYEYKGDKDTAYNQVVECLQTIEDTEDDNWDDWDYLDEVLNDSVDVYTTDLTEWLNRSVNNIFYIDKALNEYGDFESGFQLLSTAQYLAYKEIWRKVIELVKRYL